MLLRGHRRFARVWALAAWALAATAGAAGTARAPQAVAWTESLNGALARAGTELKPVLVVFSSPDCPWCVRLRTETLGETEVVAALEGFICVTVDAARDPGTAQSFQLRGVPATLILSGDGRVQSLAEGFMDKKAFLAFLDAYRAGSGQAGEASSLLDGWLAALQSKEVAAAQWPDLMAGLGVKENRVRLHRALLAYQPCPRRDWAELLRHPKLAVRLGTLEILEELAGESFGYDPWDDAAANRGPLARWREWADGEAHDAQPVYAPLTEEQIAAYIRDLASRDRGRSARAVRMLEQAGASVIPVLESWASANRDAGEDALRPVREIRYFLLLPDALGAERGRVAHRLVFGNQDDRLRSLETVATGGERAVPVLLEFLSDADPLIRETAVDGLYAAGKERAGPHLNALLATEKDDEVIHAVIRGASCLKGPQAVGLAGPFLAHANEDLVVAALASLSRTKSTQAAAAVRGCLTNGQWRVRAAALEAIGKLRDRDAGDAVAACLADADPFVRRTAVLTLAKLSAKKSAKRLAAVFLADDQLKGPVLAALRELDVEIPESFGPALKGKDDEVILSVLDGLGEGDAKTWPLALPFVRHANGDIACAAIRVVAREGRGAGDALSALAAVLQEGVKERVTAVFESYAAEQRSEDPFGVDGADGVVDGADAVDAVDGGGALADVFAAFEPKAPASSPQVGLQDIFAAFEAGEAQGLPPSAPDGAGAASVTLSQAREKIRQLAVGYLDARHAPELRLAAAQMLLAVEDAAGVAYLLGAIDSLTADERLAVANRAERMRGKAVSGLAKRLLRDASPEVRRAAVSLCLKDVTSDRLAELMAAVCEPEAVLMPQDLFEESYAWHQAVRGRATRRTLGRTARQILDAQSGKSAGDGVRIMALVLLEACWQEGDQAFVEPCLENGNPFVRRMAGYTLGKRLPKAFAARIKRVAEDTSEWVREVVPAVYGRNGTVSWSVYFDAEHAVDGLDGFRSSESRLKVPDEGVEALTALCRDPVERVRRAAALCLFSNREKIDLALLVKLIESSDKAARLADPLSDVLLKSSVGWLKGMNVGGVLRLIDVLAARIDDDDAEKLNALRKQVAGDTEAPDERAAAVLRKAATGRPAPGVRPPPDGGAADGAAAAAGGAAETAQARRRVVFFRNPGCRDCDRVEDMLKALGAEFSDLSVEVLNVRNPEHARINEVLCDRFGVEEVAHLTAPAVFCGAGRLIRNEITFEALGRLLSQAEALQTAWRTVDREAEARAGRDVGERYSAMGPWLVFWAGLLDGINPCAFATLIFLLSYLQFTRRGPREILAVGCLFVAGVFLAYFLLGLWLVELIERYALRGRFGVVLNGAMAVFVAGVALLNLWDGVQCLRGRMGDMVLQLPRILKTRIRDVVGASSKHRHFVAAAFVAGVVVAMLELACTGQVYAPTLLYMLKTGQGRWGAVTYLWLYNVAFVMPLVAVFVCAYGGLRSERLTLWLRQHAALVKFATALLFGVLFAVFAGSLLK